MKMITPLVSALFLGACATGYQPKSFTGGFSEIRLNEDTYSINVAGNGYTGSDRAKNIALLRASDLAMKAGFDRFIVVSGDVSEKYAGSTPVTSQLIGRTVITDGGTPIVKPEANVVIRMLRPSDPAYATAFDAKLIYSQLRPLFPAEQQPS